MGESPSKKVQEHKEDNEVKELFKWAKHKKVPPKNLDTLLHTNQNGEQKSDKLNNKTKNT
jgi:hypothetical protein